MKGQGRVYRPKVRGRSTARWWLDYSIGGKRHRESSGTSVKNDAYRLLRQRIGDRESGKLVGRPDRVTLTDLHAQLEQRYALKGNKSLKRAKQAFVHLYRLLGSERRVPELTQDVVNDYLQRRVAEGAARASANYEVSILTSALSQAVDNRLLPFCPRFKLPKVRNARQGFFTPGDFAAVLLELPEEVRPVVQFLHATGWRLNEVLTLTWAQIDWDGQVITIGGDKTKGEDDRVFPFGVAPDLKALVEARFAARDGLFVFHRSGKRIKTFIKAWRNACRRADLDGKLVHDLRRTAAREFRRSGVTEGEIMKAAGWRTRSMFDRYNIIDEADLAQGLAKRFNGKQTANIAASPQTESSVTPSSTR
jgi:integrase